MSSEPGEKKVLFLNENFQGKDQLITHTAVISQSLFFFPFLIFQPEGDLSGPFSQQAWQPLPKKYNIKG